MTVTNYARTTTNRNEEIVRSVRENNHLCRIDSLKISETRHCDIEIGKRIVGGQKSTRFTSSAITTYGTEPPRCQQSQKRMHACTRLMHNGTRSARSVTWG